MTNSLLFQIAGSGRPAKSASESQILPAISGFALWLRPTSTTGPSNTVSCPTCWARFSLCDFGAFSRCISFGRGLVPPGGI